MHPSHSAIAEALQQSQFAKAEQMAIQLVKTMPINGQSWMMLGEALLRQHYGQAARRAFDRAWLLDPEATWVEMVYEEVDRTAPGAERPDVEALLAAYHPITVSAAIIAKNEERCIARCIESLQGAVDEIIVMDSGSTDKTVEIVKSFPGVKIYESEWTDSFAELRNKALAQVSSDWVIWLDADEWLEPQDRGKIREAAGLFEGVKGVIPSLHVCINNIVDGGGEMKDFSVPRLFPANRGLRYEGRVHEQLASEGEGIFTSKLLNKPVNIRLHHDGYLTSIKLDKHKIDRNVRLLRMMTEEDPESPGWRYFLGRELLAGGNKDEALHQLREAIRLAASYPRFGRAAEVYMLIGRIYAERRAWDEVEDCCRQALALHPDYPDAHHTLAELYARRAQKLLKEAERHVAAAQDGFLTYRGTVTADREIPAWKAPLLQADLYVHAGKLAEARKVLQQLQSKYARLPNVRKKIAFINHQQKQLSDPFMSKQMLQSNLQEIRSRRLMPSEATGTIQEK